MSVRLNYTGDRTSTGAITKALLSQHEKFEKSPSSADGNSSSLPGRIMSPALKNYCTQGSLFTTRVVTVN